MRISDWSSDVCSSDLAAADTANPLNGDAHILAVVGAQTIFDGCLYAQEYAIGRRGPRVAARTGLASRSEEHTSELQSLMRISYAVFCLKKKKTKNIQHATTYSIYIQHTYY